MTQCIASFERLKLEQLPRLFEPGHAESVRALDWVRDFPKDMGDGYLDELERLNKEQYALSKCMPEIEQILQPRLPQFLEEFKNGDIQIDPDSVPDYKISAFGSTDTLLGVTSAFGSIEKEVGSLTYGFGASSPTGLCLEYKDAPSSVIAFGVCLGGLMVRQIQGIKPIESRGNFDIPIRKRSTQGLDWFDWRALMVRAVIETGKSIGSDKVIIESGRKNVWTEITYPDGTPHLPLDRAIEIYDGTAERLGFTQIDDGDWCMDLTDTGKIG